MHATWRPTGSRGRPGPQVTTIRHMQDVLSNPWRRAVLYYLGRRQGDVSLGVLTRHLVAWHRRAVAASPREETDAEEIHRQRLRVHVQEMAELGVVAYDPHRETVWLPDDVAVSVTPPWHGHDASSLPDEESRQLLTTN